MIVVDASLAAKWVFDERDCEAARSWLSATSQRVAAPDLLLIEVARAIVRRANDAQTTLEHARQLARTWARVVGTAIDLHRLTGDRVTAASELALDLRHPLPDCIYLALAIELDCALITCDAKFRDRAVDVYGRILLLSEVSA